VAGEEAGSATDVKATDVKATDVKATEVQATEVQATKLEAAEVDAAQVEAPAVGKPRAAATPGDEDLPPPFAEPQPVGNRYLAAALAWLWPGFGHLYLRRWSRGLALCLLVLVMVVVGASLDGHLWRFEGPPTASADAAMAALLTVVSWGLGGPYLVLRLGGYGGDIASRGFEYGTAFLLTAALMNLLLVFDAWDISAGRKW